MVTPRLSSAIATVRSAAVRATLSASGFVFSMGLNRLTTGLSSSSCFTRFWGVCLPPQLASSTAASAARQTANHLCLFISVIVLPFVLLIAQ